MKKIIILCLLWSAIGTAQTNPYVIIGNARTNGIETLANGMTGGEAFPDRNGGVNTTELTETLGGNSDYSSTYNSNSSSRNSDYTPNGSPAVQQNFSSGKDLFAKDKIFLTFEIQKLRSWLKVSDNQLDQALNAHQLYQHYTDKMNGQFLALQKYYSELAKHLRYNTSKLKKAYIKSEKAHDWQLFEFGSCPTNIDRSMTIIGNDSLVAVTNEISTHPLFGYSITKVIVLTNTASYIGPDGIGLAKVPAFKDCWGYVQTSLLSSK